MGLSRHQKGCYMDLLIAQFNFKTLSLETIKTVLGQDQAVWAVLSSKFKQDSEGNFYNERLSFEIERRKKFTESRRKNREKKPEITYDASYEKHMIPHMENENRNTVFVTKSEVEISEMEAGATVEYCSITLHRKYTKERIFELWKAFRIQHDKSPHTDRMDKIRHFRNWINKQPYEQEKQGGRIEPQFVYKKL